MIDIILNQFSIDDSGDDIIMDYIFLRSGYACVCLSVKIGSLSRIASLTPRRQ